MAKTPFDADRGAGTITLDTNEVIIVEDTKHPRYDSRIDKPITEEFLASLAKRQLKPGIVFKNEDGKCEIADGRRRLRGLRILNERRAKGSEKYRFWAVYLKILPNEKMNEVVNGVRLEANLHESDTFSEKARNAHDHMTRFGWSAERAGILIGVTAKTVEKMVAALECAAPVLAALDAGRIGLGAALELADLPKADQVAKLTAIQEGTAKPERGSKPKKGGATKTGRPSAGMVKKIEAIAKDAVLNPGEKILIRWFAGDLSTDKMLAEFPAFAAAFETKKTTKKAA